MAKAALSTVLIVLLWSSEAWAAPPPLTYEDASQSQTRDERDSRVVYSVVKHFVQKEDGRLVYWGGSKPGKTSNHDRVMIIAMQTAWIAAPRVRHPTLTSTSQIPAVD